VSKGGAEAHAWTSRIANFKGFASGHQERPVCERFGYSAAARPDTLGQVAILIWQLR
jgi:hypothetical protein